MPIDYTNTYAAWAEAFTIFAKYDKYPADVAVDHEVIYAGPDPNAVEPAHLTRLDELGWHIDEEYDCFYKFV